MAKYTVSQGDTIPSIALATGFFWKTIWNDGNNAALKAKRKNQNVLYTGDEVYIPELETKTESRPTEARHKFRRKGDPIKIAIKLMKGDKPRSNEAYVLEIGPKTFKGSTDGDGVLKQFIPGDASSGTLRLKGGKEVHTLFIGHLDPIDEVTGVQQRLSNLGYDCEETGDLDDQTVRALTNFQTDNNLDTTGKIDDATKSSLADLTQ